MVSVKRDLVNELHAPARRHYRRRRVLLHGLLDLYQADLVEMIPYASVNKGYKYILTVINAFSKYAWALPLKTKTGKEVTQAMKDILHSKKNITPSNLQTDNGKEFYNSDFQKLMEQLNINHYSTYSTLKSSIIERFNRTLKNKMWKEFSMQGNYRCKYRHAFAKGYQPTWSNEIFTIATVQNTNPRTYLIKDGRGEPILGAFYDEELQRVKHPDVFLIEKVLRRKGNKVRVKWLGMDSSHNSWIAKKDVL
ncbi:uncharacterized protein [Onthophagus taurus]|uniref:uncharacterized protein n=1 Tax=Onthophagus taurus TaxID=166361 RepID=UPI0039BEA3C0